MCIQVKTYRIVRFDIIVNYIIYCKLYLSTAAKKYPGNGKGNKRFLERMAREDQKKKLKAVKIRLLRKETISRRKRVFNMLNTIEK